MDKTFIIFSQPFDMNSGGALALHKLCHLIKQLGRECYIFPYFPGAPLDNCTNDLFLNNIKLTEENLIHYKVHSEFNTPVLEPKSYKAIENNKDIIAIYPEIIKGNPLNAANVVRWLLHNPGFHTGKVYYETNEIYFKFGHETQGVNIPNSVMSNNILSVTHFASDLYNEDNVAFQRAGTAYCVRKGKDKQLCHDLSESICIDGLTHQEISQIFKRVKQFISYDTRTYYSLLAAACGCESIVIPDPGVSEEQCFPDIRTRYGVAYGFDNIEKSKLTRHLVKDYLVSRDMASKDNVLNCLEEIELFFNR